MSEVKKDSSADKAGIQKDDVLEQLAYREVTKKDSVEWSQFFPLDSMRGPNDTAVYDRWPHFFYSLQHFDYYEVRVKCRRGDALQPPIEVQAEVDTTWPLEDRGLLLMQELRLQKANNMMQALTFGLDYTVISIKKMYLGLGSILRGRISAKNLGGPIKIAETTFAAAEDPFLLLLWLGMISLNLAVVNFLPIPVLDGGHMVFLIYEGLRRRRPSETVQAVATYAGLAVILSLMVFVFYNDIRSLWPWLMSRFGAG